jgi:antitoxin component YwqK of YwqJK toxin-antitoxin module
LHCDSSLSHTVTPNEFPKHCYDELKTNRENGVDSSQQIFYECNVNHFVKDYEMYKIDTIWVENDWTVEPVKIVGIQEVEATYFMSKYELYSPDSSQHHIISRFYDIDELKNECISGVFRNKSVEEWLNGKEHGKWVFWDKKGTKTREVEYDHGKKIKETIY